MIQTLNPSKTDEIMSRYRPIAPKPEPPSLSTNFDTNGGGGGGSVVVPDKFRQSPYLRNIWSHLQARPTRTRKRAARSSTPIPLRKYHKVGGAAPPFLGLCSPNSHLASPAQNLSYQGFTICDYDDPNCHRNHYHHPPPAPPNGDTAIKSVAIEKPIITLPLLSCTEVSGGAERNPIDLNATAAEGGGLEERDLLLQLQVPAPNKNNAVISPRPVRPVGSSISVVGPMTEDPEAQAVVKRAEEVEDAAEAEAFPVVISDRSNKVRMANSAYKELVGQPECPWLDSMMMSSGKRISGEVMLHLPGIPSSGNGFSCWVRIEWGSGGNKSCVNAFCTVVRLVCESKDYMFSWRFHTREVSPSASKV